jgi:hypothetical protein
VTPALSPRPRRKRPSAHLAEWDLSADCKPSQTIDSTEILARAVSVDLERSLRAGSDLMDGMSIALLSQGRSGKSRC